MFIVQYVLNIHMYVEPIIPLLYTPRRTPRSLPIEHANSMHRHTSVLVQGLMHMAIENISSAYTSANVKHHRSFMYTHACTYVILNTCQVM